MKNMMIGIGSVLFIYLLFLTNLEIAWKNLILGILCVGIIAFRQYFTGRQEFRSAYKSIILIFNLAFLIFLTFNVAFGLHVNSTIIWISYVLVSLALLVVNFAVAAR